MALIDLNDFSLCLNVKMDREKKLMIHYLKKERCSSV